MPVLGSCIIYFSALWLKALPTGTIYDVESRPSVSRGLHWPRGRMGTFGRKHSLMLANEAPDSVREAE